MKFDKITDEQLKWAENNINTRKLKLEIDKRLLEEYSNLINNVDQLNELYGTLIDGIDKLKSLYY